jgi:hypothetical protein
MKKLLIFAVLLGVLAFLLFQVLPRRATQAVTKPPPPPIWNSGAVHSTFAGVQIRELDATRAELIFSYDLENSSNTDYQLTKGPTAVVMTRLKSSDTLSSDEAAELDHSIFLPARNRIRISLRISRPFSWPTGLKTGQMGPLHQDKFRTLLSQEVGGIAGFTLFDQATRLQIELPGSWQAVQAPSTVAQLY